MVFVDSDGVFADFDLHIYNLFGSYPSQMDDAEMWRLANAHPDFWNGMPIKDGAHDLWAAFKHLNPTVLTGCPKSDYDRAAAHKKIWWKKNFDHENVITCLSKDKALHMTSPDDWIIDDMSKNCKRWIKAGGQAYRYDGDAQKCIAFMRSRGVI